jgi:hypothetical protein
VNSIGFPTTLVAAAVVAIVGVICNVKGWHYESDTKLLLTQCVGLICDAVAGVLLWIHGLHTSTMNKFQRLSSFHQEVGQALGLKPPPKFCLVGILLLIASTQGCQNLTPAQNVSMAEQGFTAVVIGLNTARATHRIDDKAWSVIQIGITAGNDFLDVLDTQVASGEITTNQQLIKSAAWLAFQQVMTQLTAYRQKATMVQNGGSTTSPAASNRRLSTSANDRYRSGVERPRIYARTTATDHRCAA